TARRLGIDRFVHAIRARWRATSSRCVESTQAPPGPSRRHGPWQSALVLAAWNDSRIHAVPFTQTALYSSPSRPRRTVLETGTIVGDKYRLEEPIGQGGMATVWRAVHTTLDRP